MNYKDLLDEVRQYVISFFEKHNNPKLLYHNLSHTKSVVAAAVQIANHYQLSDEDYFVVITAAWFHDTGYMVDVQKHEQSSTQVATDFLKHQGTDPAVIERVSTVIMATQMPQNPEGLLSEILCDADLFHLGTEDARKKSKLLREECSLMMGIELDKDDWREKTIHLLEVHHYFTDYAQLLLNDQKNRNMEMMKKKQAESAEKKEEKEPKQQKDEKPLSHVMIQKEKLEAAEDKDKDKKKKDDKPARGIETMFRISSTNHQRLSDMADNKAHIMITVNSIILSAIISLVLRKLDQSSFMLIPTIMLIGVSLLTITFSILATRPSIPSGIFTDKDIEDRSVNLLFFGNFYRMSLEKYSDGMFQMMEDSEFLYGSLIKDNYSQGVVLGKKYRLLRISYNIFMFGLIVSVLAFIIASTVNG